MKKCIIHDCYPEWSTEIIFREINKPYEAGYFYCPICRLESLGKANPNALRNWEAINNQNKEEKK